MRIVDEVKLDFQDVLLKPKRSTLNSRMQVELEREFHFRSPGAPAWKGIPIIAANMTSVATYDTALVMQQNKMLTCIPKGHNITNLEHLELLGRFVIPSFGLHDVPTKNSFKFLCLDVANGYIEAFVEHTKYVRDTYQRVVIMAGNVVSPEMTEALILAGADIVKIGIGSGASCATRIKTGVGYPQLSAIMECADAAHGLGGMICSDGGCTNPGDVAKAFAAGADFVMLGSMLAGHNENGTDFYGMASKRANDENAGGLKDYRTSEGWELKLPPRGKLQDTIQDILGGLRSTCAYVGARVIKDLPKCATFVRCNHQINESLLQYRS